MSNIGVIIFGYGAHVFAIKGTYVVYIVIVTYHVMHMLKGPPTLHLKKFPRRITLALGKKKKRKRKIGLLIVGVGVVLNRNVVDSEIIFLTSQSFV